MKSFNIISTIIVLSILLSSCAKKPDDDRQSDVVQDTSVNDTHNDDDLQKTVKIPELVGSFLDSELQSTLISEGFLLDVNTQYNESVPKGHIIAQKPEGGTQVEENGVYLELTVSLGKEEIVNEDESFVPITEIADTASDTSTVKSGIDSKDTPSPVPVGRGYIKQPYLVRDSIYTFAMTGYSISVSDGKYGIVDIWGNAVGAQSYSKLTYCPNHGLTSPDIAEKTALADDLFIAPDCDCGTFETNNTVYVYDNTRERVYSAEISNGRLSIIDITDSDTFGENERYIVIKYSSDADLMMYLGENMESVETIFKAENVPMKYGVITKDLEYITDFTYDSITYGNDCYIVEKDGLFGYVGVDGKLYYSCRFTKANTAYLGAAWVKENGKWGIIGF